MTRTRRPNLLFIMDDQHRHDYLSTAGASFVRTPNLDRLAERGIRFTQCITNAPVCAPARIGLASGLQPARLGCLDNNCYLPRHVTPYYARLQDAGYRVGCVGKLDLAKPDPYNGRRGDRPRVFGWGFTHPVECEGKMHAGMADEPRGPYGFWLQDQGLFDRFREDYAARGARGWIEGASHDSVLPEEAFEDVYIGRRATEWIDSVPDDYPWHLFVSFVGPHDPFDPPTTYADRYRDAAVPPAVRSGSEGKPGWVNARRRNLSDDEVAVTRRQYCASIEAIDDQVGRIIAAVERRGMGADTFIIFASDHGEMLGDHGLYTKSVPYEAALRVPLVAAGPGIPGGRTSDALVELIDVNPTLCALAVLPAQEGLDARDFSAVLAGERSIHRQEGASALREFRLVRTAEHKLVVHHTGEVELYDLVNDPDEQKNVAADRPDTVRDLRRRLRQRFHFPP
ncbi:MAG: sulfatase-like hydrolase/transferase [Gemmatimonadetes bacterium]|nr:sulfatase-like hydrolase/transferase [Gemmatimonadota bacterium]